MNFYFFYFIQVWLNFTNFCTCVQFNYQNVFITSLIVLKVHATISSNLPLLTAPLRTFQVHACDGEELSLKCLPETVINIYLAQYGRSVDSDTNHVCPQSLTSQQLNSSSSLTNNSYKVPKSIKCSTTEKLKYALLNKLVAACREKRVCKIMTNPKSFGNIDPCPGIRKYAEVSYKCRPNTFYNKVVCEGESLNLTCNTSYRILIYSTLFGSTKYGVAECPQPTSYFHNGFQEVCNSSDSTEHVMKKCNGARSCQIEATRTNFGEPGCKTQSRIHLKIVYTCILKEAFKKSNIKFDKDERDLSSNSNHLTTSVPTTTTSDYSDFIQAPRMKNSNAQQTSTITSSNVHHQSESFIIPKDFIVKVHDYQPNNDSPKFDNITVSSKTLYRVADSHWLSSKKVLKILIDWLIAYKVIKDNSDLILLFLLISVSAMLFLFFILLSTRLFFKKDKLNSEIKNKKKTSPSSAINGIERKENTTMDDLLEQLDPIMVSTVIDPLSDLSNNTTPHKFKEYLNHQALSNSDSIGFNISSVASFNNSTLPNSKRNSFTIKSPNNSQPKALFGTLNSYF